MSGTASMTRVDDLERSDLGLSSLRHPLEVSQSGECSFRFWIECQRQHFPYHIHDVWQKLTVVELTGLS